MFGLEFWVNYGVKFLVAIIGCIIAWVIPEYSLRYVEFRNKAKGVNSILDMPKYYKKYGVVAFLGVCVFAFYYMPIISAVFTLIFTLIAIFGVCVDNMIRIIPNKMVLVILTLGIVYRILDGGYKSLKSSIIAFFIVILVFGLSCAFTYFLKGTRGVGMGDIKLSMAISIAVGFPGVIYFFIGMALSISAYCVWGLSKGVLTKNSYFPMCLQIMAGFIFALIAPYSFFIL